MSSEHEELLKAEAYALGALDADERGAFESHLGRCVACRRAVDAAAAAATGIALTAESVPVPPGSGDRLVARFRSDVQGALPRQDNGGGAGLAILMAAVAVAGLAFGGWSKSEADRQRARADLLAGQVAALQEKVDDCHKERSAQKLDVERLAQLNRILDAPDLQTYKLKKTGPVGRGEVEIAYSPTRGVAVIGESVPEFKDQVYKLWALEGGAPVPMGHIDLSGSGPIHVEGPRQVASVKFALSLEPRSNPNVTKPTQLAYLPG
jgi:anti-sigma-K factor RskA